MVLCYGSLGEWTVAWQAPLWVSLRGGALVWLTSECCRELWAGLNHKDTKYEFVKLDEWKCGIFISRRRRNWDFNLFVSGDAQKPRVAWSSSRASRLVGANNSTYSPWAHWLSLRTVLLIPNWESECSSFVSHQLTWNNTLQLPSRWFLGASI